LLPSTRITAGDGPDPADARVDHALGEVGVLGQEAVVGVDRVHPGLPGHAQDVLGVQVGGQRLPALADDVALVGLEAVQCLAILLRVDADGAHAQFRGGAHDTDRDLRTVGDQDRGDGGVVGTHHGTVYCRKLPRTSSRVNRRIGTGRRFQMRAAAHSANVNSECQPSGGAPIRHRERLQCSASRLSGLCAKRLE
jgi:hypothetical protein